MGWFDWLCCRKAETLPEEEEEAVVRPASSSSSSGSSLVEGTAEMGKVASKVKSFFYSEKPETAHVRNSVAPVRGSGPETVVGETYEPLASPRSPLIRGIGTLTPPDSPVFPPYKRLKSEDALYLNFPILVDEETIGYVQRNKLMVILKGLSGSGKSTLAHSIKRVYEDAVICSADHFFMVDGEYNFDFHKLKDAHADCKNRARNAAKTNCHVIVIDNTNIKNWESQDYISMCKKYHYVAVILEPQTPWSFDASILVERSTHGLEQKFLEDKLKIYQKPLPVFYAWFLNVPDSEMIFKMAWQLLERSLLEVNEFYKDFSQITELDSIEEMLEYFTNQNATLHATSKFTSRGKPSGAMEYINNPKVKESMAKRFPIHIIGYVITPRTFGARVRLTEEELELWGANDHETPPNNLVQENHPQTPQKKCNVDEGVEEEIYTEEITDICEARVIFQRQELDKSRFCPTSGKGSRAHLTLGVAQNVRPVATGFDVMEIVACEQSLKGNSTKGIEDENLMEVDSDTQQNVTYNISGAVLKSYGDGRWVIYPDTASIVHSLFSAFY